MSATEVHPTAILDPSAELGQGVKIGPYSVVGPACRLGEGTILEAHAQVISHTQLGAENHLFPGCWIGGPPQDRKYKGEETWLILGDRNVVREGVTLHRATGEGRKTLIGSDNYFMCFSHVGHNCQIGSGVMVANYVGISGFCAIEDQVVIGGHAGLHQYVRVGKLAMIGGCARIGQDLPPFMLVAREATEVRGLNLVGLQRNGISRESREALKQAYKLLYRSKLNTMDAIAQIRRGVELTQEVEYLIQFLDRMRADRKGRQLQTLSDE